MKSRWLECDLGPGTLAIGASAGFKLKGPKEQVVVAQS